MDVKLLTSMGSVWRGNPPFAWQQADMMKNGDISQ